MSRQIVVDSCVAVKWFLVEQDSDDAIALLSGELKLIAPDFVLVDLANALWKNERLGRLAAALADRALAESPKYFDHLLPTQALLQDALKLGRAVQHPVYDCLYVVASRLSGARLVTSDERMIKKFAGTPDGANIVHLAEWK